MRPLSARPTATRIVSSALLVASLATAAAAEPTGGRRTLEFDLSGFVPFAVGGEVFGVGTVEGEVVHARLDVRFVVTDTGDWSFGGSFVDFPMGGSIGFSSELEGWSGTGTFSTVVETDAMNGTLAIPDGAAFYSWFFVWSGGTPYVLPGGGIGVKPVEGVFEVLKLSLTLAACPNGDVDLPWEDVGGGLAGSTGLPVLTATGSLCDEEAGTVRLENALPNGTTNLVIGLSALEMPFLGGLLVPSPDVVALGLPVDADGVMELDFVWPPGLPSGFQFWMQHWIADPAGPVGFAASNGLRACVP